MEVAADPETRERLAELATRMGAVEQVTARLGERQGTTDVTLAQLQRGIQQLSLEFTAQRSELEQINTKLMKDPLVQEAQHRDIRDQKAHQTALPSRLVNEATTSPLSQGPSTPLSQRMTKSPQGTPTCTGR